MKRNIPTALTSMLIAVAPFLAHAQVSASAEAPVNGVLAATTSQVPAATVGWKNDSAANQWTGVTFLVTEAVILDKISIEYSKCGGRARGADITVEIIQLNPDAGRFSQTLSEATVIQSQDFTLPKKMPESGYLTFAITPVELPASPIAYAYRLSFKEPAGDRYVSFVRANPDAKGAAISIDEDSYNFRSDDGGKNYNTLTYKNLPVVCLQGRVAGE